MTDTSNAGSSSLVVLVTGGASGLGKACVDLYAEKGARVIIFDLKLEGVSAGQGDYINVEAFAGDVSSEQDVQAVANHIAAKHGRLDVLVNCAGIATRAAVFDFKTSTPHDLALFSKIIQVNTVGTFNVIRLMMPIMGKQEPDADGQRGVIINASSVLGLEAVGGFAAYAASKAAVAGLTLPLAREFGPLGIRVIAIAPGFCDTPMISNLPLPVKNFYNSRLEQLAIFPKRMLRPQEFALLVHSIVQNHAINGELIRLDGGVRMTVSDSSPPGKVVCKGDHPQAVLDESGDPQED
ncbi:3-hydroxyacyl-CoA dehydrogenase type-2 [Hypsibius exemplaris]|uniref:3-hydroxyacyl-CoA dehydrogenase type-2 n=1 Tax=Hypsibius exemplaris TaxID=2072580 RepID=A0A1W0X605_HYPEX|nr:3-hydroxyacyl-CoA dehydrogenase type-2 [Hypsibius exemplaris]